MARLKIIVLEKYGDKLHFALWADVPVARQAFYADAAKVSAWKDAEAADNAALQNGSVVERVASYPFEAGAGVPRIKAQLEAMAVKFQAEIDAYNPWNRYGTTFNGASWANGGVA